MGNLAGLNRLDSFSHPFEQRLVVGQAVPRDVNNDHAEVQCRNILLVFDTASDGSHLVARKGRPYPGVDALV